MIDNIIDASEMLEKIENRKDGDSGFFGTFFNGDDAIMKYHLYDENYNHKGDFQTYRK